MSNDVVNEATREQWRELGFFYDCDIKAKVWRIVGSRAGLQAFVRELRTYASNPNNTQISEHVHLGPYMYLEIGTWSEPEITEHWIAGPLYSLLSLADEIERQISTAKVGDVFNLKAIFAPRSPYDLLLEIADEAFDPAKADQACW